MEEDEGSSKVETAKAERSVWLMKCPVVVAKSWQAHTPSDPLAKVVLSLDPLRPPEDPSSLQFTMEMASTEPGNIPKSYSLNMSKDIVPMSVFSETSHGKVAVEGESGT
ncbi:hypothetical protein NL676_025605 [Syzygium grande]|nr:hypothetical protein NL676_025605 [Syzygium grande]